MHSKFSALAVVLGVATFASVALAGSSFDNEKCHAEASLTGACTAGADCTATVVVTTKGEFHVNKDYPAKADAKGAGISFVSKDFSIPDGHKGVMLVKFKPASKGKVPVSITEKLGICTDQACPPLTEFTVTLDVDVK